MPPAPETKDTNAQLVQTPAVETDKSAPNQLTNAVPEIMIGVSSDGPQGKIVGQVTDDAGLPNCVSTVDRLFLRAMADRGSDLCSGRWRLYTC